MLVSRLTLASVTLIILSSVIRTQTSQNIAAAKQGGLPQQPIAAKERTDLQDEGFKGKVRTIREEEEWLRGPHVGKGRQLTEVKEFNEGGNLISASVFYNGSTNYTTFYGYIDGERASRSEGLDCKLRYEYENGKLVTVKMTLKDGSKWESRKYNYKDGFTEFLEYDHHGDLMSKSHYKYDKDGNEIEEDIYETYKDPDKVIMRFKYTYDSFDSNGNWTMRTGVFSSLKRGLDVFEPSGKTYRTITYFP